MQSTFYLPRDFALSKKTNGSHEFVAMVIKDRIKKEQLKSFHNLKDFLPEKKFCENTKMIFKAN